MSHLLGKKLDINPVMQELKNKIFYIQNFNSLLSLIVILGSMFEYDLYYFKHYYKKHEDGEKFEINENGDSKYQGQQYRVLFSIVCIITAFMSVYSNILEFRLKKLQGTLFEGRINFF